MHNYSLHMVCHCVTGSKNLIKDQGVTYSLIQSFVAPKPYFLLHNSKKQAIFTSFILQIFEINGIVVGLKNYKYCLYLRRESL